MQPVDKSLHTPGLPSAAEPAVPVKHRHKDKKTSHKAHEALKKDHRHTVQPRELRGKVKKEFEFLNNHINSPYAQVKAIKHTDGHITFELKLLASLPLRGQTRAEGTPRDIMGIVGSFLTPREKQVGAAAMPEAGGALGAPEFDPSISRFRSDAKKYARTIRSKSDEIIESRLMDTVAMGPTRPYLVTFSKDGALLDMQEYWEGLHFSGDDIAKSPEAIHVILTRRMQMKAKTGEEKENIEYTFAHMDVYRSRFPEDAENLIELKANDNFPVWTVDNTIEGFDTIDDPATKTRIGLILDFLNLKETNELIKKSKA